MKRVVVLFILAFRFGHITLASNPNKLMADMTKVSKAENVKFVAMQTENKN